MKITKIKRLVSFGNHENIELEAEIEDGETIEKCHRQLLSEIYKEIGRLRDADLAVRDNDDLKQMVQNRLRHKENLDKDIQKLKQKKEKIESWLSKFKISTDAFDKDEIPF